eukprot:TRINITY_DN4045_c0_g1_i3.p1 TRINITY_DN4045_c0_g1~~TRINITY_DN4045_c0_g1_i3.p1  ORF type:complete len:417 (+),score=67.36 TRINITY_DN4045_c0_g1_i3:68-1318(+)
MEDNRNSNEEKKVMWRLYERDHKQEPGVDFWDRTSDWGTVEKSEVIWEGSLLSKRKLFFAKSMYYALTSDALYCFEDDLKEKAVKVCLNFQKVSVIELDAFKRDVGPGFRLLKDGSSRELYAKNPGDYHNWLKALKRVCIFTNFNAYYKIASVLGKGSFSMVTMAKSKVNGEHYAVKIMSKEQLEKKKSGKEILKNEISVLRKLSHPNLIKLYEVYETEGSVYLVLEYIKNGSLWDFVSQKKDFNEKDRKKIMKGVLNGLVQLQKLKIVHRDLKPDNVLVKHQSFHIEEIKIIDFGLSWNKRSNTHAYLRCGTPGFIPPEVYTMDNSQPSVPEYASDIFSAGVIFYLLLAGQLPFERDTSQEIFEANKECAIDFRLKTFDLVSKKGNTLVEQNLSESTPLADANARERSIEKDNSI